MKFQKIREKGFSLSESHLFENLIKSKFFKFEQPIKKMVNKNCNLRLTKINIKCTGIETINNHESKHSKKNNTNFFGKIKVGLW
jgi:hypothetical protein